LGYWFAFHPHQKEFLEGAEQGYIGFGCGSPSQIILIPAKDMTPLLDGMNRTERDDGRSYWHIQIQRHGNSWILQRRSGEKRVDIIRHVIDAEIPVAGHIGLTPQSVNMMGGYKVQGKTLNAIEQLMRDAVALDRAGVAGSYLEGIPREVAAMITAEVEAPTIGIGAGPDCSGQVLVIHDLLSLTFAQPAKFVRHYADAAALITEAVLAFKADVASHQFPSDAESYHLPKETQAALDTILHRKHSLRR